MKRFARPLRHRRFRRVWCGQAISSIGDGIFNIAMIGAVLLHHRYADLGFVLAVECAAMVLMSLLGGALADRIRRGRAMALSDVMQIGAVLGFTLGVANGPLVAILPFAALMGIGEAMFQPAFDALTPSLVPDEDLSEANALTSVTAKLGGFVGQALGGTLLAVCGYKVALLVDLGTFAVPLLTLIGLNDPVPERSESQSVLRDAWAGLSAVRDRPWVMTVILQGTVQLLLVMGPAVVLLPILLKQRGLFDAYGIIVALEAAGFVLGGLATSVWKPRRTGVVALCALSLLSLQLLALLLGLPLYILGFTVLATGFGYAVFRVLWVSALQRAFPDELLGRALSVEMLGTFALAPVGLALTPLAMGVLGDKPLLIAALLILVASTVIPLFLRQVRMFASDDPATSEPVTVPAGTAHDR
jgi:MFS family permease